MRKVASFLLLVVPSLLVSSVAYGSTRSVCEEQSTVIRWIAENRDSGVSQAAVQSVVAQDSSNGYSLGVKLMILNAVADLYKHPNVAPLDASASYQEICLKKLGDSKGP